eukprot:CAMPEP_0118676898 /NCGR_PEP_ID=MMETSP0800-20121206/2313_1 /TAXON_ID=210618 ORGANISM="Striatella unipunctata, Strain CCMP2910" /NCGR_SAMPLE_ID=MMETSP0800 /ASSEMBLY_ACC=CAM_ASM_000638 /LENGTH=314 /DNA_ID=CAMNT_0006572483 /DNA_START=309 /DNA_END=1253 /DNA_ORIENTATION=-
MVLTLPQVAVQIVKIIVCPESVEMQYTDDRSLVREQCGPSCISFHFVTLLVNLLVYLLAVVMAWMSSDLPSVFNEREAIFNASWINLFVMAAGLALVILTNEPTTSPNTTAFLFTGITNAIVLTTCWMLLAPKFKRIMSGEKVVVSKLLEQRDSSGRESCGRDTMTRASFAISNLAHKGHTSSTTTFQDSWENSFQMNGSNSFNKDNPNNNSIRNGDDSIRGKQPLFAVEEDEEQSASDLPTAMLHHRRVLMKPHEPPPRRFEQQLLAMKEVIGNVASRSLEGRPMDRQDWQSLQSQSQLLNEMIGRMEYDWDA